MGLHRAWPDAVIIGVDIKPQPRYPFIFVQDDAMTFPLEGYDFIWASPPCQKYTAARTLQKREHADLITPTRKRLMESGIPYVIENVPGAPLLEPATICGLALGLNVKRHRLFECSLPIDSTQCPKGHHGNWLIVFGWSALQRSNGAGTGPKKDRGKTKGKSVSHSEACNAMGINWMKPTELSQAIPPAYSQYIAEQLP